MIHLYQNNGYNIVLDVNSGAVHVVDKAAYDVIGALEEQNELHTAETLKTPETFEFLRSKLGSTYAEEDIRDILEAVATITQEGRLFTRDVYEDYIDEVKQRKTVVKALCLHIAHDCNLACRYCFAEEGEYHGRRALMSYEVGKKALDFLIANSGKRRNLEVDFFGGEPLMAMDTVKKTVEYARSIEEEHDKCFRFTITTNGVLLNDENIEYINREMSNAVLSIDGRKEVNDDLRPTVNGKGSYDVIVPKFQKLIEGRGTKDYYLRGTFTRFHQDFAEDVKALASIGRNISVEPVVGKEDDPYALQEADLPALKAEYERLAEYLRDHPETNFFHFNVDLAQGPCVIKRLRGCGAGCEYVAITPEGDIYPCHQFVGNEDYKLGSLYDGTFDKELSGRFAGLNIYTREECKDCWARFYCSGGCSASNLLVNGDIKKPHRVGCELERKRLECAIALRAIAAGMAE